MPAPPAHTPKARAKANPAGPFALRKAVPEDEAAVSACASAAYARYVPRIGRAPAPMIAQFGSAITKGEIWVAVEPKAATAILGYIQYYPRDQHMFLEGVAVFPQHAGRGIGGQLIRACEAAARRAGLSTVRLYTNVAMTENHTLYPHLGYAEVDRRQEDGFDRIYYEKRLNAEDAK